MSRLVRCPITDRGEGDIVGCGSTNVVFDEKEGLYDCLDCGIWFGGQGDTLEYVEVNNS